MTDKETIAFKLLFRESGWPWIKLDNAFKRIKELEKTIKLQENELADKEKALEGQKRMYDDLYQKHYGNRTD